MIANNELVGIEICKRKKPEYMTKSFVRGEYSPVNYMTQYKMLSQRWWQYSTHVSVLDDSEKLIMGNGNEKSMIK